MSVGLFPLPFSSSSFYGQVVMLFAEPALNYLISFNTCFEIEGSGITLATKIVLLEETVVCLKWMLLV